MLEFIYFIYTHSGVAMIINIFFLNMMASLFAKRKYTNFFTYYILPLVIYSAIYFYPEYALHYNLIPYFYHFMVLMGINLIWILLFLKGSIPQKMIYYLYFFTVYKCIVFFLGAFIYDYQYILDRNTYILLDMGSSVIPIVSLWKFSKFFLAHPLNTVAKSLDRKQILLMAYCPLSIFITFQMADPSVQFNPSYFISISAGLLIFNLPIFYYLFTKFGENNESRLQLEKALAETNAQVARYRYTILIEEQARKERHELKNKYFYIQTLLKEKKLDKLNTFLVDHIGELSQDDSGIYTHNVLIDHVLNTKLLQAKKYGIKTYTEILLPEKFSINEEDFCTIILNLLDNAIEASIKEKNPDIQIYLNIKNNYLVFCIKNKVGHDILKTNPKLHTSKNNKSAHGLGIKIIKKAVRNSNGMFDVTTESNYFVATVMIPVETYEEKAINKVFYNSNKQTDEVTLTR